MRLIDERWHPSATERMAFAESLVDDGSTVSVKMASHVASCPECRAEVESVCGSLDFMGEAAALECPRELTAQILLRAKNERRGIEARGLRYRSRVLAAKGLAYVACLAVIMSGAYGAVLWNFSKEGAQTEPPRRLVAGVFSLEALRKTSPEEELLSAAVMSPQRQPQNPWEREQRRAVLTLDDDISEALEALERNPACVRASKLVSLNRRRLKETLKALYVERSL